MSIRRLTTATLAAATLIATAIVTMGSAQAAMTCGNAPQFVVRDGKVYGAFPVQGRAWVLIHCPRELRQ